MVAELGIQVFSRIVYITHVDSPSSTMHHYTTKFQIDTGIWKAMANGMRGSLFSMSNVVNLESEGSMAPRAASNAFRYIGHVLSTSIVDTVVGVWAKSSTML